MAEWFDALNLALYELLKCGNESCELFYPYNNFNRCTFCDSKPLSVTRIQMRGWEEIEEYNSTNNSIEAEFKLQDYVYEELLIDEHTEKNIAAFNFLPANIDPLQHILNIKHLCENNENKLLLTPLNATKFFISPRSGEGKEILLDSAKKIRIVDKESSAKQKYMLHLKPLDIPQRVLTID